MKEEVVGTLKYFAFFDYSPTFEQIHAFLRLKTSFASLKKTLQALIKENRLSEKSGRYTLGEYNRAQQNSLEKRVSESRRKIRRVRLFLRLISFFPQLKLVGLSGSVAMLNARARDDIDLFIITAKNRMWTGRFICLIISSFFGRRRFNDSHTSNKLCLNLFFEEASMAVPEIKRSLYVAHEVLQMMPLIERGNTYSQFLKANDWIYTIFPNGRRIEAFMPEKIKIGKKRSSEPGNMFGDLAEKLLRVTQLALINRHKTTELVTDNQLWFFPDDFEKKSNFRVVNRSAFSVGKKQSKRR